MYISCMGMLHQIVVVGTFWAMDGVGMVAEFTMLSKSACVSFIFSSDGCVGPVVMLRSIAFWSMIRLKSLERLKLK